MLQHIVHQLIKAFGKEVLEQWIPLDRLCITSITDPEIHLANIPVPDLLFQSYSIPFAIVKSNISRVVIKCPWASFFKNFDKNTLKVSIDGLELVLRIKQLNELNDELARDLYIKSKTNYLNKWMKSLSSFGLLKSSKHRNTVPKILNALHITIRNVRITFVDDILYERPFAIVIKANLIKGGGIDPDNSKIDERLLLSDEKDDSEGINKSLLTAISLHSRGTEIYYATYGEEEKVSKECYGDNSAGHASHVSPWDQSFLPQVDTPGYREDEGNNYLNPSPEHSIIPSYTEATEGDQKEDLHVIPSKHFHPEDSIDLPSDGSDASSHSSDEIFIERDEVSELLNVKRSIFCLSCSTPCCSEDIGGLEYGDMNVKDDAERYLAILRLPCKVYRISPSSGVKLDIVLKFWSMTALFAMPTANRNTYRSLNVYISSNEADEEEFTASDFNENLKLTFTSELIECLYNLVRYMQILSSFKGLSSSDLYQTPSVEDCKKYMELLNKSRLLKPSELDMEFMREFEQRTPFSLIVRLRELASASLKWKKNVQGLFFNACCNTDNNEENELDLRENVFSTRWFYNEFGFNLIVPNVQFDVVAIKGYDLSTSDSVKMPSFILEISTFIFKSTTQTNKRSKMEIIASKPIIRCGLAQVDIKKRAIVTRILLKTDDGGEMLFMYPDDMFENPEYFFSDYGAEDIKKLQETNVFKVIIDEYRNFVKDVLLVLPNFNVILATLLHFYSKLDPNVLDNIAASLLTLELFESRSNIHNVHNLRIISLIKEYQKFCNRTIFHTKNGKLLFKLYISNENIRNDSEQCQSDFVNANEMFVANDDLLNKWKFCQSIIDPFEEDATKMNNSDNTTEVASDRSVTEQDEIGNSSSLADPPFASLEIRTFAADKEVDEDSSECINLTEEDGFYTPSGQDELGVTPSLFSSSVYCDRVRVWHSNTHHLNFSSSANYDPVSLLVRGLNVYYDSSGSVHNTVDVLELKVTSPDNSVVEVMSAKDLEYLRRDHSRRLRANIFLVTVYTRFWAPFLDGKDVFISVYQSVRLLIDRIKNVVTVTERVLREPIILKPCDNAELLQSLTMYDLKVSDRFNRDIIDLNCFLIKSVKCVVYLMADDTVYSAKLYDSTLEFLRDDSKKIKININGSNIVKFVESENNSRMDGLLLLCSDLAQIKHNKLYENISSHGQIIMEYTRGGDEGDDITVEIRKLHHMIDPKLIQELINIFKWIKLHASARVNGGDSTQNEDSHMDYPQLVDNIYAPSGAIDATSHAEVNEGVGRQGTTIELVAGKMVNIRLLLHDVSVHYEGIGIKFDVYSVLVSKYPFTVDLSIPRIHLSLLHAFTKHILALTALNLKLHASTDGNVTHSGGDEVAEASAQDSISSILGECAAPFSPSLKMKLTCSHTAVWGFSYTNIPSRAFVDVKEASHVLYHLLHEDWYSQLTRALLPSCSDENVVIIPLILTHLPKSVRLVSLLERKWLADWLMKFCPNTTAECCEDAVKSILKSFKIARNVQNRDCISIKLSFGTINNGKFITGNVNLNDFVATLHLESILYTLNTLSNETPQSLLRTWRRADPTNVVKEKAEGGLAEHTDVCHTTPAGKTSFLTTPDQLQRTGASFEMSGGHKGSEEGEESVEHGGYMLNVRVNVEDVDVCIPYKCDLLFENTVSTVMLPEVTTLSLASSKRPVEELCNFRILCVLQLERLFSKFCFKSTIIGHNRINLACFDDNFEEDELLYETLDTIRAQKNIRFFESYNGSESDWFLTNTCRHLDVEVFTTGEVIDGDGVLIGVLSIDNLNIDSCILSKKKCSIKLNIETFEVVDPLKRYIIKNVYETRIAALDLLQNDPPPNEQPRQILSNILFSDNTFNVKVTIENTRAQLYPNTINAVANIFKGIRLSRGEGGGGKSGVDGSNNKVHVNISVCLSMYEVWIHPSSTEDRQVPLVGARGKNIINKLRILQLNRQYGPLIVPKIIKVAEMLPGGIRTGINVNSARERNDVVIGMMISVTCAYSSKKTSVVSLKYLGAALGKVNTIHDMDMLVDDKEEFLFVNVSEPNERVLMELRHALAKMKRLENGHLLISLELNKTKISLSLDNLLQLILLKPFIQTCFAQFKRQQKERTQQYHKSDLEDFVDDVTWICKRNKLEVDLSNLLQQPRTIGEDTDIFGGKSEQGEGIECNSHDGIASGNYGMEVKENSIPDNRRTQGRDKANKNDVSSDSSTMMMLMSVFRVLNCLYYDGSCELSVSVCVKDFQFVFFSGMSELSLLVSAQYSKMEMTHTRFGSDLNRLIFDYSLVFNVSLLDSNMNVNEMVLQSTVLMAQVSHEGAAGRPALVLNIDISGIAIELSSSLFRFVQYMTSVLSLLSRDLDKTGEIFTDVNIYNELESDVSLFSGVVRKSTIDNLMTLPGGKCVKSASSEFLLFLRSTHYPRFTNYNVLSGVTLETLGEEWMVNEGKNLLFGNSNNVKTLLGVFNDSKSVEGTNNIDLKEVIHSDPSLLFLGKYQNITKLYNVPNKGNVLLVEPFVLDDSDVINVVIGTNIRIQNSTNIHLLVSQDTKIGYFTKLAYRIAQKDEPRENMKILYIDPFTCVSIPMDWYGNDFMPIIAPVFNHEHDDFEDDFIDFQELYKLLNRQNLSEPEHEREFTLKFKGSLAFKCSITPYEVNKCDEQEAHSYKFVVNIEPMIIFTNTLPFDIVVHASIHKNILDGKHNYDALELYKNKGGIKKLKPLETWGFPFEEQRIYLKIKITGCQLQQPRTIGEDTDIFGGKSEQGEGIECNSHDGIASGNYGMEVKENSISDNRRTQGRDKTCMEYVSSLFCLYLPNVGSSVVTRPLRYVSGPIEEFVLSGYGAILDGVNEYFRGPELLCESLKRMVVTLEAGRNAIKIMWPFVFENVTTAFLLLNGYLIPPGYRLYGNLQDASSTRIRAFINLGTQLYLHTNQSYRLDLTSTTLLRTPIMLTVPLSLIRRYITTELNSADSHKIDIDLVLNSIAKTSQLLPLKNYRRPTDNKQPRTIGEDTDIFGGKSEQGEGIECNSHDGIASGNYGMEVEENSIPDNRRTQGNDTCDTARSCYGMDDYSMDVHSSPSLLPLAYGKIRRLRRRVFRRVDDDEPSSVLSSNVLDSDEKVRQEDRTLCVCLGCTVRYNNGLRMVSISHAYMFVNKLPFAVCVCGVPGGVNVNEYNRSNFVKDLVLQPGETRDLNIQYSHVYIVKLENTMCSNSFPLISSRVPNVIQLELNSHSIIYTTMATRGILIQVDIISGIYPGTTVPSTFNGYYYVLTIPIRAQYQLLNLTTLPVSFTVPENIRSAEAQAVDNYETDDSFESNLMNKIGILLPLCITHYVPNNNKFNEQHQVAIKVLNTDASDWTLHTFSHIKEGYSNIRFIKDGHKRNMYATTTMRYSGTIIITLIESKDIAIQINRLRYTHIDAYTHWHSAILNLNLPKISFTATNKRKIILALHLTNTHSILKLQSNAHKDECNDVDTTSDSPSDREVPRPEDISTFTDAPGNQIDEADVYPNAPSRSPGDATDIQRTNFRHEPGMQECVRDGGVLCNGWVIEFALLVKTVHVDHFVQGYIPVIMKSLAKRHSRQESFLHVRASCTLIPKTLPIYDSIYVKTSPLSINIEMRVIEQLFDYIELIRVQSNDTDAGGNNACRRSAIVLPEPRWTECKSRLPVYITKLNIEPISLVLAIRTSEVKLSRQTLQLLDSLPLDTPSVCVHFASERRNHSIVGWNELGQSLKHSYLRQLIRQSLPSAWLSSSFALLHGLIKGTCLLFSQPFVSCKKFKNSFEGFTLGIGNGIILFILYIIGGLAQSLGHILNIFHKIMGRGRPRPQGILDAMWLGINGLLLDLFFRPWKRLISDVKKSRGKGDPITKITWKIVVNLAKCALCPVFGTVNMLITVVEGLSNVLLGDFEQFAHVYESEQLEHTLHNVEDKGRHPNLIRRMKTATIRKFAQ